MGIKFTDAVYGIMLGKKDINKDIAVAFFLRFSSPVLVALYMFSMGKAEPRPYSKTLERAGISWVVVTNTFTQLGLEQEKKKHTC